MWDGNLFYFLTHGVLLTIAGVIGLIGNVLTLIVLCRPQMRSSTNCLLIGLSVCDSIYVICSVLLYGLTTVHHYTKSLPYYYYHIYPHITPYIYLIIRAAQTMSVYVTLIVTIERWIAVCHPLRAMALCTIRRARCCLVITAIFALIYNVTRFWEKKVKMYQKDGETFYLISYNRKFYTETYIQVYLHWLSMTVMYVVPFVTLAVLNTFIVLQVRRARAERAEMTISQQREIKLAFMLLVIVIMFFICNLLPFVHTSIFVFLGKRYYDITWTSELVYVSNLLLTINHSANFVIYAIFGKKLRHAFLRVFCSCLNKESPLNSAQSAQEIHLINL